MTAVLPSHSMNKRGPSLQAAIAGCGRIASLFAKDKRRNYVATHAQAYHKVRGVQLAAACDLDRARLEDFGRTWEVRCLFTNFSKMLADVKPDLVSICTWPDSHYSLVKEAIEGKVQAIFCEKPLTTNLRDADRLVEMSRKSGVLLGVNHSRRWDEGHQRFKKFLAGGGLGKIQHVDCYYTAGIVNTGTHLFDLLLYFLGPAAWVWTSPSPVLGDKDLTVSGTVFFSNGVQAVLHGMDVNQYLIFEMDFYGTEGRARISNSGFQLQRWKKGPSPYFSGYKELLPAKSTPLAGTKMLYNGIKNMVEAVQGRAPVLCTAADGRDSLEIIAALRLSLQKGKRIELPLINRNVRVL